MSDMFAAAVSRMRNQGKMRDELIARVTPQYCHIPQGGYSPEFAGESTVDDVMQDPIISGNIRRLIQRHKDNLVIKASGIQGYWGDHQLVAAKQLIQNIDEQFAPKKRDQKPHVELTRETRQIIKFLINSEVRNAVGYEELQTLNGQEVKAVNTRGAYGKRAEKHVRNKKTVILSESPRKVQNPVVSCGYAIADDMTQDERNSIMQTVRKFPIKSTVTIIAADGTREIKLVSEFNPQESSEESKATTKLAKQIAAKTPDVIKYQHIVGNIGNVVK